MNSIQVDIPVGWGKISAQIFGDPQANPNAKPILALHGYLDNSNSFKPLAPLLTQSNEYYIIAVDLPGMGFSSNIPDGIPYTLKFYLMALRRVVKHFKISKLFLAAHSFGGLIAMTYSACYPDEVVGLILIDFAMRPSDFDKKPMISDCWREELDDYLKAEEMFEEKRKKSVAKELTYEHALKRLLESNTQIDEAAARILLERGLIRINNNYEYTRDIKLVAGTTVRDFHSEYNGKALFENLKCPILLIYAVPAPYGDFTFQKVMEMMSEIKEKSESSVEMVSIESTHHFHMLKPDETSQIALKFLKEKYVDMVETSSVVIEQI